MRQIVYLKKCDIFSVKIMLRDQNDTIAAIATPLGEAGISVIRVSGIRAIEITDSMFRGKASLLRVPTHSIHFGRIADSSEGVIDEVLVSVFKKPHSYTGEDVVEISCHGSHYVTSKILETVIGNGARLADPGEFTQRAFLCGKMDLMQAEAVADLIHSKTALAHRASLEQLNGSLSTSILSIRQKLIDLCSLLELELDFAEEGIELTDHKRVESFFDETITDLEILINSYKYGRIIRDGVKAVLAGAPNVGKSSLLNILLKQNRAIVSDVPGTTRDVIEEAILIEGIAFRLADTAGLRKTSDLVEQEGVRRSRNQISGADLILLLIDSSEIITADGLEIVSEVVQRFGEKVLIVLNKVDIMHPKFGLEPFEARDRINISCITGRGIHELTEKMMQRVISNCDPMSSSVRIQSERHRDLLKKTLTSVIAARSTLLENLTGEFIAVDLRASLNYLGEIIGITTPEDVLHNIFSKFCIGK
jgi:tRNA modification GTPase